MGGREALIANGNSATRFFCDSVKIRSGEVRGSTGEPGHFEHNVSKHSGGVSAIATDGKVDRQSVIDRPVGTHSPDLLQESCHIVMHITRLHLT